MPVINAMTQCVSACAASMHAPARTRSRLNRFEDINFTPRKAQTVASSLLSSYALCVIFFPASYFTSSSPTEVDDRTLDRFEDS